MKIITLIENISLISLDDHKRCWVKICSNKANHVCVNGENWCDDHFGPQVKHPEPRNCDKCGKLHNTYVQNNFTGVNYPIKTCYECVYKNAFSYIPFTEKVILND